MSQTATRLSYSKYPRSLAPNAVGQPGIQLAMLRHFAALLLCAAWMQAQTSPPASPSISGQKHSVSDEDALFPPHKLNGPTSLVRGVLKQIDPIHDQLVIRTFGGGDVRIAFDARTRLTPESAGEHVTGIRNGSVLSVDTMLRDGKLFASSVRVGVSNAAELNGQIVAFDPGRARLTLRDPISPKNIVVQVTPATTITQADKASTQTALLPGALVKVSFSATDKSAKRIEILAERGASFTFQGRILAVDLRSQTLSLSNDTDQSLRELTFGALDPQSRNLLREGDSVTIEAEFDGDRYNVRSIAPAPHNP
ncbi:MAG TPA: DUF5666 domain-containing protein [Candidatus Sulfotelmatobacter sp.]|jgi:hypothetical protein